MPTQDDWATSRDSRGDISKIHRVHIVPWFYLAYKILSRSDAFLCNLIQDLGEHAPANAGKLAASPWMFEALMLLVDIPTSIKNQSAVRMAATWLRHFRRSWHRPFTEGNAIQITFTKYLPMTLCRDRSYLSLAIFLCFPLFPPTISEVIVCDQLSKPQKQNLAFLSLGHNTSSYNPAASHLLIEAYKSHNWSVRNTRPSLFSSNLGTLRHTYYASKANKVLNFWKSDNRRSNRP